jgi:hypothetical protein
MSQLETERLLPRLRRLFANQVRLWDRALDDLQPWEQEQPLRWRGVGHRRLAGALLPDETAAASRSG